MLAGSTTTPEAATGTGAGCTSERNSGRIALLAAFILVHGDGQEKSFPCAGSGGACCAEILFTVSW